MTRYRLHDYFEPDTFCRAVQDELGDEFLIRMRQKLGGRDLRLPRADSHLFDDHWLVVAVGREDAEALTKLFDGERGYVPLLQPDKKQRNIQAAIREGLSTLEMAQMFVISERHMRRLLRQYGIDKPNLRKNPKRAISKKTLAAMNSCALEAAG